MHSLRNLPSSLLEASSVRPETQRRYRRCLRCLEEFLGVNSLPRWTNQVLDDVLCDYFEGVYLEGKGSSVAAGTLAAVLWA